MFNVKKYDFKADPNYLDRLNWFRRWTKFRRGENAHFGQTAYKILRFMKSSASEPFQGRSKGEIPGRARRKERLNRSNLKQAFLSDLDDELFMYSIQCIRFGSSKVRRLNRAQAYFINFSFDRSPFLIHRLRNKIALVKSCFKVYGLFVIKL